VPRYKIVVASLGGNFMSDFLTAAGLCLLAPAGLIICFALGDYGAGSPADAVAQLAVATWLAGWALGLLVVGKALDELARIRRAAEGEAPARA
jgi:hypothetical protein